MSKCHGAYRSVVLQVAVVVFVAATSVTGSAHAFEAVADGVPWISQAGLVPPLNVMPSDNAMTTRTSLGQWRDFNAQMLTRKVEDVKGFHSRGSGPADLVLPKAPILAPLPFEIWGAVDLRGRERLADGDVTTRLGVDYKVTKRTAIGVTVEHDDAKPVTGQAGQQDDKMALRLSFNATPHIAIEATSKWEVGTTAVEQHHFARNTVVVAPRVGHQFKLEGGQTLLPYASVKREIQIGDVQNTVAASKPSQTAGVGVTLAKPDAYSLNLSADVDAVEVREQPLNVHGRMQLSIPLR
jgi:hypothetical protein